MTGTAPLLNDRVALVTGASSGLGWRFAEVLAESGARVLATGRRTDNLKRLTDAIRARGGQVAPLALDVCDPRSIVAAFDHAECTFGAVDILVNNAGAGHTGRAVSQPLEQVDALLATNVRGPFLMAQECARRLIAAGRGGAIVNISSIGATRAGSSAKAALYCATKAALSRLTETLAMEWAEHHINVNAIAPGFFASEMSGPFLEKYGEQVRAGFPRHRVGEPKDLDSTLLYLVSPQSHFVTGTCVVVDDAQQGR